MRFWPTLPLVELHVCASFLQKAHGLGPRGAPAARVGRKRRSVAALKGASTKASHESAKEDKNSAIRDVPTTPSVTTTVLELAASTAQHYFSVAPPLVELGQGHVIRSRLPPASSEARQHIHEEAPRPTRGTLSTAPGDARRAPASPKLSESKGASR